MQHFLWVFPVCESVPLGVLNLQRVKSVNKTIQFFETFCKTSYHQYREILYMDIFVHVHVYDASSLIFIVLV